MSIHQIVIKTETSGCCAALCGDLTVKIENRNLPSQSVQLQGSSWDDFCDEIDETLKPLSDLRRRNARAMLSFFCFALILLAASPAILQYSPSTVDDDDRNDANLADSGIIVLGLLSIEKLLRFFCETSEKECFCAALYTCYAHISPDIALELGWINGYHNFVMPFFIQTFKRTHERLKALEEKTAPKKEETAQDEVAATYGGLNGFNTGTLMLENGGPSMMAPPMQNGIDMSGFGVPNGMPSQGGMPGMPGMGMGM